MTTSVCDVRCVCFRMTGDVDATEDVIHFYHHFLRIFTVNICAILVYQLKQTINEHLTCFKHDRCQSCIGGGLTGLLKVSDCFVFQHIKAFRNLFISLSKAR